jgi:hypothetical protein
MLGTHGVLEDSTKRLSYLIVVRATEGSDKLS